MKIFLFSFLIIGFSFGHNTWDIIQESIWNPKCTMCHTSSSSFAEQSGLILTADVAYERRKCNPLEIHAAEDGLELVGTSGIASLYSSFYGKK